MGIQCVLSHNSYLPHTKPEIIYSVHNRYRSNWKNPYPKEEKLEIMHGDGNDNNNINGDESTSKTTKKKKRRIGRPKSTKKKKKKKKIFEKKKKKKKKKS